MYPLNHKKVGLDEVDVPGFCLLLVLAPALGGSISFFARRFLHWRCRRYGNGRLSCRGCQVGKLFPPLLQVISDGQRMQPQEDTQVILSVHKLTCQTLEFDLLS